MLTPTETKGTYVLQDRDVITSDPQQGYVLRLRDLDEADRPREKMLGAGPQSLDVSELVAVLWGVGTRREDVLAMARRTLHEYGERAVGNEHDARRLAEAADIPLTKACQLIAGFELGRRYNARSQGRPLYIRNLDQAAEYLQGMGHSAKEQLRGLYLNSRYQVIHDEVISVGSLTANIVHPREVFQPAISHGAVAVIIAHNHPSGSLEPTAADVQVTGQLRAAGTLLGIDLLDHLIVTADSCTSIIEPNSQENPND
jgi:DNA repair protein RadC